MCPHDLIYLRAPRLLLRLQLFSSRNRGPFKIFISDISLRSLFQAQPTHTVSLCFPPPLFVCRVQSVTQRVTTAGFCVCLPITEPPITELAVALERCELHAQKNAFSCFFFFFFAPSRGHLFPALLNLTGCGALREEICGTKKTPPTGKSITL